MAIILCFMTSYDVRVSHCVYIIVVCGVFSIMLQILLFYRKHNKSATNIILGVTRKAAAFES